MEGMLLEIPTKVFDIDTVLLSMGSFTLNFLIVSIASTHSILSNKAFRAAFDGLSASVCTGTW